MHIYVYIDRQMNMQYKFKQYILDILYDWVKKMIDQSENTNK